MAHKFIKITHSGLFMVEDRKVHSFASNDQRDFVVDGPAFYFFATPDKNPCIAFMELYPEATRRNDELHPSCYGLLLGDTLEDLLAISSVLNAMLICDWMPSAAGNGWNLRVLSDVHGDGEDRVFHRQFIESVNELLGENLTVYECSNPSKVKDGIQPEPNQESPPKDPDEDIFIDLLQHINPEGDDSLIEIEEDLLNSEEFDFTPEDGHVTMSDDDPDNDDAVFQQGDFEEKDQEAEPAGERRRDKAA